ncbi:mCG145934, partial [Mus musculus]
NDHIIALEMNKQCFPFTGSLSHHVYPQCRGRSSKPWVTRRRFRQHICWNLLLQDSSLYRRPAETPSLAGLSNY